MKTLAETNYGARQIKVLKGLEGIRQRPAMYIGDTGKRGFHHLLWEIVDNAVDEALAGYCKHIVVKLFADGSAEVVDDGRGIPVDIHPEEKKSALELVVTTLHAGGKFEKNAYKVSGGLHGVGISVVNALSEYMVVRVRRNGKIYEQRYSRGKVTSPLNVLGEVPPTDERKTGTAVRFKPDEEIFGKRSWDVELIRSRLRELAYLNPGLHIKLEVEAALLEKAERAEKAEMAESEGGPLVEEFYYKEGIVEYVRFLNSTKKPIHPSVIFGSKTDESGFYGVEFALQYNETYYPTIYAFTNTIRNDEGGTHVVGFKAGLTRAVNDFIKREKLLKEGGVSGDDVLEGLTAVISVKVAEPQFEGQTKTKLGNSEVKPLVEKFVYEKLKEWFEQHMDEAKLIAKKAISALQARLAAKKAKEVVRRKTVFETNLLPGKLADCSTKRAEEAELFIVEGESAGGSAKQGRDRYFQAILPLKGKIINVEKANQVKVLRNDEIRALITAIGTGIGADFNLEKLRYHKIIIMTDADVDGNHIRTLLLTFFFRYMRPLIEKGYVYAAQPPLYKITKGKVVRYAYTEEAKDKIVQELTQGDDKKKVTIQRYKGLGEMNPEQLWETTMDPNARLLKRITVKDAEAADILFSTLMGEDVERRKHFIEEHATEVAELDI